MHDGALAAAMQRCVSDFSDRASDTQARRRQCSRPNPVYHFPLAPPNRSLLSSFDNFYGYRDNITAAIHYVEYRIGLTAGVETAKLRKHEIFTTMKYLCTFRIKRLRGCGIGAGYYDVV